jgi:hypothetical protein
LPDEKLGDGGGNGYIFEGTKGKLMANYERMPVLLPTASMKDIKFPAYPAARARPGSRTLYAMG